GQTVDLNTEIGLTGIMNPQGELNRPAARQQHVVVVGIVVLVKLRGDREITRHADGHDDGGDRVGGIRLQAAGRGDTADGDGADMRAVAGPRLGEEVGRLLTDSQGGWEAWKTA